MHLVPGLMTIVPLRFGPIFSQKSSSRDPSVVDRPCEVSKDGSRSDWLFSFGTEVLSARCLTLSYWQVETIFRGNFVLQGQRLTGR